MNRSLKLRVLSLILAVVMLIGLVPVYAFAEEADVQNVTTENETAIAVQTAAVDIDGELASIGMTVVTDEESTLAPGVTMDEIVLYDANGDRVEMYVTTVDTTLDTVSVYANYKDNQCAVWGMQTLSEQVAAMEANYDEPFKVVAGINASYYNTSTGAPTGAFVMEGVDASTSGDSYAFFAVLKDGTYMIGKKGDYSTYKDQIKEAIGGWSHIVVDGEIASGLDSTTKYPRQTLGLTEDGKLILMTADGSQTQTVGLTIQEQAEVMLALGCVDAIHLDGGNSATFSGIREGSDTFTTINSPSGGGERAVSNTLVIVSTAVADGTFDHAVISADYDYFLPYSSYTFSSIGADATNGPADIPDTAVWALSDTSFGSITDGCFVSNGTLGDVDVQLVDNGTVVGTKTIHVVDPTEISFELSATSVPYGKTAELGFNVYYGYNNVYFTSTAFEFTVDPAAAGTMNGFNFSAAEENDITSATVTASYKYSNDVDATTISIEFGKGSEVLFDFEDGDISNWHATYTIDAWLDEKNQERTTALRYPGLGDSANYGGALAEEESYVFLASEANGGKVKNGEYSLGLRLDHTQAEGLGGWIYDYLYYTGEEKVLRDVANGVSGIRLGMWIYSPGISNVCFHPHMYYDDGVSANRIYASIQGQDVLAKWSTNYKVPEAGWMYIYVDLTNLSDDKVQTFGANYSAESSYYSVYPAIMRLITGAAIDDPEEIILYIDDITLDYSDAVDDRDAPVISDAVVSTDGANDVTLDGQTVTTNVLSFSASVAEVTANNMTGLNYNSAKIYVDGIDMSGNSGFNAGNGIISLNNVSLVDGDHSVCFVIFDNQGNETRLTKTLTVETSASNAKVYLTGHNDGSTTPMADSVYYIDVMASDAAQIESISTTVKLNTAHSFEYDNIICAAGVSVETSYDALDHELTLNIIHDGSQSGEALLLSIPVRVWTYAGGGGTPPDLDVVFKTTYGKIAYTGETYSDYICGFYTALSVDTEHDGVNTWSALHTHTVTELDDTAATCTEAGYSGRTYCDVCASVVDWGTTILATGHTYEIGDDNILDCDCGAAFTGLYMDGKTYADGVVVADGWVGYSYYQDGIMLTGIHMVPAADGSGDFYYDFGVDGVCESGTKYTGLLQKTDGKYYYAKIGVLTSGWNLIGEDWYYFDAETMAAASGELALGVITYQFEETGKLTSGVWAKTLYGTRYYYGPSYHKSGWQTIDGKDYCFDNGYRLEGGWQLILESQQYRNWYFFDENGVCEDKTVKPEDGIYTDRNGVAGALDGIGLSGLRAINDKYYYFSHHGYAQNNGTYAGRLFREDYTAFTGFLEKDGARYYYENGITATRGIYLIDNEYYVINWGGEVRTSGSYYVSASFCDLPVGTYQVDAEGKLLNGIVETDGEKLLYVNGKTASNGLYKIDDAYYYSYWGGVLKTDGRYYVSTSYCDLPGKTNYSFDAEGKMLNGVEEVDGTLYLYQNGSTATCGLYEIDGEYYYAYWGGVLKTDGRYYVSTSYCDLPGKTNYSFDAEGKMLNGVEEVDGTMYLYINGTTATCGLYEIDGEYYYAYWGGVLKTDGRYYVSTSYCDLPGKTNYSFDAEGKMLNGVEEVDGTMYLYINGTTAACGLYEIDGEYYYSYWGGVLKTDGRYYVSTSYCDLPGKTNYSFDAEGKMLNGVEEVNGTMYLYINGTTATCGLYEIDGEYYYSYWGGVLKTDGRYYVSTSYCDLPTGNYTFGTDGKMLDGFVTTDNGIYYYVDGNTPAPGLIYEDGYYYYVNWGGKLVVNQTFYVSKTNGYTIPMNYTFDELGRLVA